MLRLVSYDIVFQEIPGEVTLALNLSGCPNRCPGCHSPHLQREIGEILDEAVLEGLLGSYGSTVTCVCFMGGDAEPGRVAEMAARVRRFAGNNLKTGWYSGKNEFPESVDIDRFDFIKLGPYVKALGGLDSPDTNQRLYRIENGEKIDISETFRPVK